ncbi:hypothetical protein BABINDRAFT_159895 [Babjeviella inositovora NRRL Y-12698]|uniref:C2H2-type domain-containing protein n=1 Tax=Babjeviella inositovora NRRL Y-12698 TaxID=984486 RepID=A0A1E3QVE7_9ASCO|nr:uncharacterized protein BABINDRAFT_159895 [Babjeviella inositovora NRRL Y-12698]ODQ81628.1 hypothetical protein BABINDRAFT_159895 [Babjeviella inositovora NRRL Y-12698]
MYNAHNTVNSNYLSHNSSQEHGLTSAERLNKNEETELYDYLNLSPPIFDPAQGSAHFRPSQNGAVPQSQSGTPHSPMNLLTPQFQLQTPPQKHLVPTFTTENTPPAAPTTAFPNGFEFEQNSDLDLFFQVDTKPIDSNNVTMVNSGGFLQATPSQSFHGSNSSNSFNSLQGYSNDVSRSYPKDVPRSYSNNPQVNGYSNSYTNTLHPGNAQSGFDLGFLSPHAVSNRRYSNHSNSNSMAYSEVSSNPNSPFMDALSPSGFNTGAVSPGLLANPDSDVLSLINGQDAFTLGDGIDFPSDFDQGPVFAKFDFAEQNQFENSATAMNMMQFGNGVANSEFSMMNNTSAVDNNSQFVNSNSNSPHIPQIQLPSQGQDYANSSQTGFQNLQPGQSYVASTPALTLGFESPNYAQGAPSGLQDFFLNVGLNQLTEHNLKTNQLYSSGEIVHADTQSAYSGHSPVSISINPPPEDLVRSPSLFSHSSAHSSAYNSPNRSRANSNDPKYGNSLTPFDNLPDEYNDIRKGRQRSHSNKSRSSIRSKSANRSRSGSGDLRTLNQKMLDLASNQSNKRQQKHPSSYACDLCDKTFTRPYNLKSHKRTHTNERPYVCTVCGKAFARQHDRKRHEDLHNGEKRYQCRGTLKDGTEWGCAKKFARTDALGRHFKTEAGKECIRPLLEEAARDGNFDASDGTFDVMEGFNLDPYAFFQQHGNPKLDDDELSEPRFPVPSVAITPPDSRQTFRGIDENIYS